MTFDDSGMLVVPTSVLDSWKQEVNHEETCNKCGYTWMSKARFHMTRTCPRCKEVIY
jgi:predicted Zn-ribbon and HTH transcriptional regulator